MGIMEVIQVTTTRHHFAAEIIPDIGKCSQVIHRIHPTQHIINQPAPTGTQGSQNITMV